MHDVAHVRLVNSHAESVGGDDDLSIFVNPGALVSHALICIKTSMIPNGRNALRRKRFLHLLDVLTRVAVHDAGSPRMRLNERNDLDELFRGLCMFDGKGKIRPIKPRDQLVRIAQPQQTDYITPDTLGRRSGKRHHGWTARQLRDEIAYRQIRRTEILTPLRNAMRLVNGKQGDGRARCERKKPRIIQSLGRNVEQIDFPRQRRFQNRRLLERRKRRIQARGANARFGQTAHLIAHKRDKGAYDKRHPGQHDAGNLIANAFAGTGRHDGKGVAPRKQSLDNTTLTRPEVLIAIVLPQNFARLPHQRVHPHPFPKDRRAPIKRSPDSKTVSSTIARASPQIAENRTVVLYFAINFTTQPSRKVRAAFTQAARRPRCRLWASRAQGRRNMYASFVVHTETCATRKRRPAKRNQRNGLATAGALKPHR